MKIAILVLAILCSSAAPARDYPRKEYEWKEAKVIDITFEKGAAAIIPIAALVGAPLKKTFCWIQTDDAVYVLGPVGRQLSNITLYEPIRLAIDGNTAHILSDFGKDRKLPIVEKVTRTKREQLETLKSENANPEMPQQ
jgi:precorrin-3B methylase